MPNMPAVQRLLEAGANPTVKLPQHIGHNLKYNQTLGKMMDRARVRWKRQKAKKKGANM